MPDSSRKLTVDWWLSDVATSFVTFTFVGALWGALNPFPIPGGGGTRALPSKPSKKFAPLPPFSSPASVGFYAGMAGSIVAAQRIAAGGAAVARDRQDVWSELVGLGAVYGWTAYLFKSEKRVAWNNRAVAGVFIGSIVYANTAP